MPLLLLVSLEITEALMVLVERYSASLGEV
jgi:hypothetical protein